MMPANGANGLGCQAKDRSGRNRSVACLLLALLSLTALTATARAQLEIPAQLIESVTTEGLPMPTRRSFSVDEVTTVQIAVTDFGDPAGPVFPATALQVSIVRLDDGSVVVSREDSGTTQSTLEIGNYELIVFARPEVAENLASVGVEIVDLATQQVVVNGVDSFATGSSASNPTAIEFEFDAATAGSYNFLLRDTRFPSALGNLQAIAIRSNDGSVLGTLNTAGALTLDLAEGDNVAISIVATRTTDTDRSILEYKVSDTQAVLIVNEQVEIGDFSEVVNVSIDGAPIGQPLTFTLTDFALPSALTDLTALLISETGEILAIALPGSPLAIPSLQSDSLLVRIAATPDATGSVGVQLSDNAAGPVFQDVVGIEPPASVGGTALAELSVDVPVAGEIILRVSDFEFPAAFDSVTTVVVSDGTVIASSSALGSTALTVAPGRLFISAVAQTSMPDATGLFGVSVEQNGSALGSATAATGADLTSFDVSNAGAQPIRIQLADLQIPGRFADLRLAVSQGAELVGTLLSGGSIDIDAATGDFKVSILTTLDAAVGSGSLFASVKEAPAAPSVTLDSDSTSVALGGSSVLIWSSSNADNCAASGAWSGQRATSGSETISNITSDSSFSLSCAGPGGSSEATVSIRVTAASRSSGGGSIGVLFCALLLACASLRHPHRSHVPQVGAK